MIFSIIKNGLLGPYLKILKKWSRAYRLSQKGMREIVSDPGKRERLNLAYNRLNSYEGQLFQRLFAKIFRDNNYPVIDGDWKVYFLKKEIKLPLRKENMWLDWDVAVSVIGHDPDIKITYENLIASGSVKIFFDIGANYGTHSLLFLVNGIKTISFEPNPGLKKEFDLYCSMNNVKGQMENIAMGEKRGIVNLWFQPHETWNGTIVDSVAGKLKEGEQPIKLEVMLITLDEYVQQNNIQPDLLKIDTEGNEINVLNGAIKTIIAVKPMIIFETNNFTERQALWNFFKSVGYSIHDIPFKPDNPGKVISEEQFLKKWTTNYIAVTVLK